MIGFLDLLITYIVLVNLQEVARSKKFLELLLQVVNFTGYRLIRRPLSDILQLCNIKLNVIFFHLRIFLLLNIVVEKPCFKTLGLDS